MKRILFDLLVVLVLVTTIIYVYRTYGDQINLFFFGHSDQTIYIDDLALTVTIADDKDERSQGLSGVKSLEEFEGKLFVFDKTDYYSIWMRGMLFPIDIIWIGEDLSIVHIEENVSPETYPAEFLPDEPARFVLEVNAFFTSTFNVKVGDKVSLPPSIIPKDIGPDLSI